MEARGGQNEERPKFVMWGGNVPEQEPALPSPPALVPAFGTKWYEVFWDPRTTTHLSQEYRFLRLSDQRPRPRDCTGYIAVSLGTQERHRKVGMYFDVSPTGRFEVAGLDMQILYAVTEVFAQDGAVDGDQSYWNSGRVGLHIEMIMKRGKEAVLPRVVLPRDLLAYERLEKLVQARLECVK